MSSQSIKTIVRNYFERHPNPKTTTVYPSYVRLSYSAISPTSGCSVPQERIHIMESVDHPQRQEALNPQLVFNSKGFIEQTHSFESINIGKLHCRVLNDSTFGKPQLSRSSEQWVYVAVLPEPPVKSPFCGGQGKKPYVHDFGEQMTGINRTGLFIWNKKSKIVRQVQLPDNLIPSCPCFSNEQGSSIVFSAYTRQPFGHGLAYMFARPCKIYQAAIKFSGQDQFQSSFSCISYDEHRTNIFPVVSPCFRYLFYLSGSQLTHAYYMDAVVARKHQQQWCQTHRIPQKVIGYFPGTYSFIEKGKAYAVCLSIVQTTYQILKFDLEAGTCLVMTKQYPKDGFSIDSVLPEGIITGIVTNLNFKTFFVYRNETITIIKTQNKENFVEQEYSDPIPAVYIEAPEQEVDQKYRSRVKRRPMMVFVQGGPHSTMKRGLDPEYYMLLKMGFGILHQNYSGSGGYGPEFVRKVVGQTTSMNGSQIAQLTQKVMDARPQIDRTRVHLRGLSYGATLVAYLGSRFSSLYRSGVMVNGDVDFIASLWSANSPQYNSYQHLEKEGSWSVYSLEEYLKCWKKCPISQPLNIPILHFVGGKDRGVLFRSGVFYDAIGKSQGQNVTTIFEENSWHASFTSVRDLIDRTVQIGIFVEKSTNQ